HVPRSGCPPTPAHVPGLPGHRSLRQARRHHHLRRAGRQGVTVDVQDPQRPALEPEEEARARWYALLSRLFHAPADPNLLAEIGNAESAEGEGDLPTAWRELQAAGRTAFPALIRQEYDTLFVGVGQAEVSPYLSGYAEPAAP